MGLPSGTLWATRNIDITQRDGFAQSEFQYRCSFFSWGNIDGHNPTSNDSFSPYDWGGVNNEAPYYQNQVYGSTPGNTLTSNIPQNKIFDAARANVGAPWRLPSRQEFRELIENCDYIDQNGNVIEGTNKVVTVNGFRGIYLRSKNNGQKLFFGFTGDGNGQNWANRSVGFYMTRSYYNEKNCYCMHFYDNLINYNDPRGRYIGYAVRPVCSPATLQHTHLNVSRQALADNVELLDLDDKITPIERPVILTIDSISQNDAES